MLAWVWQFLMKDFKVLLSLARSFCLYFFQDHFSLPHSMFSQIALWGITEGSTLIKPSTFFLCKWSKHGSFLSWKDFLMLFNFSLVISSFIKILSSGLKVDIHLTIFVSFLCSLVLFSSLPSWDSLPYSIILSKHFFVTVPR